MALTPKKTVRSDSVGAGHGQGEHHLYPGQVGMISSEAAGERKINSARSCLIFRNLQLPGKCSLLAHSDGR